MAKKQSRTVEPLSVDFLRVYLGNPLTQPVILIFYASFCPSCRSLERNLIPKITSQFGERLRIVQVNIEEDEGDKLYWQYATPHGVRGMPLVIVFDSKGYEIGYVSGYYPKKIWEILQTIQ